MNWVDTIVNSPKTAPPPSTYSSMPLQKIEMFVSYIGSNDSIPQQLLLQAPANHTVGIDSTINLQLKWNQVSDGIIYQVQVSTDSTFNSDTLQFTNTPNAFGYCANRKGNTKYFWRARVNNGGHYSPWSETWDFHTKGETTGLTQYTSGSKAIQVFPNPGNSIFRLENLKTESLIEVLDVRGRLILSQHNKTNSHELDLTGQDKGIYNVRITDKNGNASSIKLILQ